MSDAVEQLRYLVDEETKAKSDRMSFVQENLNELVSQGVVSVSIDRRRLYRGTDR